MKRKAALVLHRWAGLTLAAFVVLAGLTGSFLAFNQEIDAALNPSLHRVEPQAVTASLDEIAKRIETRHESLTVGYFLFSAEPGASVRAIMNTRAAADEGRLDRDSARPSEVFADPYSGRLLGERNWGEAGATRAHLVPMVYRFHVNLFLDTAGQWVTGIVATVWILALLLGTLLAVPRFRLLRKAFTVKWQASRARVFFDLHRTTGLFSVLLLAVIAFTGIYMNLPSIVEPAIAAVAPFTERPASVRAREARREDVWRIGWDEALERARAVQPSAVLAGVGRIEARGYYQVRFLAPSDIMDTGTIRVFVDGRDGSPLGAFDHRDGTVGDKIRVWQWPLHSGQGFGLPGRVLICVAGLLPLLLAATGLWLWMRRRRMRRQAQLPRGRGIAAIDRAQRSPDPSA